MFENYPDLMNVEQICLALDVGRNTAYRLLNRGELKSIRIGKIHKIPKVWLIEFITSPKDKSKTDFTTHGKSSSMSTRNKLA